MAILNKKAFKLPRLDPSTWGAIMRLGLQYDRATLTYSVLHYNNVEKLVESLSDILKDDVGFTQTCLVCGKEFSCQECRYFELCETRNLPLSCLCGKCLEEGKTLP